jgi:hypothetical protein
MPAGVEGVQREEGFWAGQALTDSRGAFTFLGVPTGSYMLKATWFPTPVTVFTPATTIESGGIVVSSTATQSTIPESAGGLGDHVYFASMPITVGDRPMRNLSVTLREASKLSGQIRFEGTKAAPAGDQLTRGAITLEPLDTRPSGFHPSPKAVIDATGRFKVEGLIPSRYVLNASGFPGWTLKSATAKARDISDESLVVSEEDVADVEVTFTDQAASIAGTVRDANGSTDASADVLVFAAEEEKRSSPRRQQLVRASRNGVYSIGGLPPGDYFIAAVDDRLTGEWPDPSFMNVLARFATRVAIADGGARTVDLRTISATIK